MNLNSLPGTGMVRAGLLKAITLLGTVLTWSASTGNLEAAALLVPNHSFEEPLAPRDTPYARPEMDAWQKSEQPPWYDPAMNFNTPWTNLMGVFFNVPFEGQFIDNCAGEQAAFLFALPAAGLFQDSGTNPSSAHAFDAKYRVGSSYQLAAGILGGGGNMKPGVTLDLSLYYRDAASNRVTVASKTVTNSTDLFPTNTHFVDFQVEVPVVKAGDPWAGQHIGIQLLSTTSFELAGGYWDLDNVRLLETLPPAPTLGSVAATNGQFVFTVLSEPGVPFEIQAATNPIAISGQWTSVTSFSNSTGTTVVTQESNGFLQRFYRARHL